MGLAWVFITAALAALAINVAVGYADGKRNLGLGCLIQGFVAVAAPIVTTAVACGLYQCCHPQAQLRLEISYEGWSIVMFLLGIVSWAVGSAIGKRKRRGISQATAAEAAENQLTTLYRIEGIILLSYINVPEPITEETLIQPLYGCDPMGIESAAGLFVAALMDEFELEEEIPSEIAEGWQTVKEVVDYIEVAKAKEEHRSETTEVKSA